MLIRMAARLKDDGGNALVVVMIISFVVASIATLSLRTGQQADSSSASDRNREGSLGVAEAGVQQALKVIQAQTGAAYVPTFTPIAGATAQGSYRVETTRCPADLTDPSRTTHQAWCDAMSPPVPKGYVLDSTATAGGNVLGRKRHVRVAITRPPLFPNGKYTLYSGSSVALNNNDELNCGSSSCPPGMSADLYANGSIVIAQGTVVNGSVTAQGYIDSSASGSQIVGNAWSGGSNSSGGWAMKLTTVGGWAKASVQGAQDGVTASCQSQPSSNYKVFPGSTAGGVTTWGTLSGATPRAIDHINTCTAPPPAVPLPPFTYNRYNYVPAPLEFGSVALFNAWIATQSISSITGTYVINDPNPSWSNPLDLSNWNIGGDLTVITNTPIFSSGITDTGLSPSAKPNIVLVSHYTPNPAQTPCSTNGGECAIYIKNQLNANTDGVCATATLLYAENGAVAIKNTSNGAKTMCGSIVSNGVLLDNNQGINYDARLESVTGFGSSTYQISRWEELPA